MADLSELALLRSNELNAKYLHRSTVYNEEATKQWLEKILNNLFNNISILWVIEDVNSNQVLGTICLWNFSEDYFVAELGYELFPKAQGKGIMFNAVKMVLQYARTCGISRVEAFTHRNNSSSIKLLEKHRFTLNPERRDPDVETNAIFELHL